MDKHELVADQEGHIALKAESAPLAFCKGNLFPLLFISRFSSISLTEYYLLINYHLMTLVHQVYSYITENLLLTAIGETESTKTNETTNENQTAKMIR